MGIKKPANPKPTREQIIRSVATSTAIETGQDSKKLQETLKANNSKYAHIQLARQTVD